MNSLENSIATRKILLISLFNSRTSIRIPSAFARLTYCLYSMLRAIDARRKIARFHIMMIESSFEERNTQRVSPFNAYKTLSEISLYQISRTLPHHSKNVADTSLSSILGPPSAFAQ
jgi:hypothetical protein